MAPVGRKAFDSRNVLARDPLIAVWQERIASPSRCTVQAPHRAMPHPNFVPVMPSTSRKTHNSGISGDASTVCDLPFKVNLMDAIADPPG